MDKEERAKYDCIKDKENLEKYQKTGKSFLYMSQKGIKELYATIATLSIYVLIIVSIGAYFYDIENQSLVKQKQMLVIQIDKYIQKDFKNMNCFEKNNFIEKYSNDPNLYAHQEMKDWLQENFDDNCGSYTKP